MPLESLASESLPNIRHLVTDPILKSDNPSFLPELSQNDWYEMVRSFNNDAGSMAKVLTIYPSLRSLINKDDIDRLTISAQDSMFSDPDYLGTPIPGRFINFLSCLKTINPDVASRHLSSALGHTMLSRLLLVDNLTVYNTHNNFTPGLSRAKICYPAEVSEITKEHDRELIERIIPELGFRYGIDDPFTQFVTCSQGKIIYSKNYFTFTDFEWAKMRTLLDFYKTKKQWSTVITIAYSMSVVAAERVDVTERGLQLVMPQKQHFHQPALPLPETRRF